MFGAKGRSEAAVVSIVLWRAYDGANLGIVEDRALHQEPLMLARVAERVIVAEHNLAHRHHPAKGAQRHYLPAAAAASPAALTHSSATVRYPRTASAPTTTDAGLLAFCS